MLDNFVDSNFDVSSATDIYSYLENSTSTFFTTITFNDSPIVLKINRATVEFKVIPVKSSMGTNYFSD